MKSSMAEKAVDMGFIDFQGKNVDLKICRFFSSRKQVQASGFGCDRADQMSVLHDRAGQMSGVHDRAEPMFF